MSYKWWLIIAIALFLGGLLIGLVTSAGVTGLLAEDVAALGELADLLGPLPQASLFLVIFIKNVTAVLISFAFSPFFLVVPVIALVFNGGLIGWVSAVVIQQESLGYLLAGLLPHGVFELPAFIMGEAVALSFGAGVILAVFNKDKRSGLLPGLKTSLKYLAVVIALLLVAAIMETYVTPLLLSRY